MATDVVVRPFLADLAENDGLDVVVMDGRAWARPHCRHRLVLGRTEVTSTAQIDALVNQSAYCLAAECSAREDARRVLAEITAAGARA